jgi:hypothetical protein
MHSIDEQYFVLNIFYVLLPQTQDVLLPTMPIVRNNSLLYSSGIISSRKKYDQSLLAIYITQMSVQFSLTSF